MSEYIGWGCREGARSVFDDEVRWLLGVSEAGLVSDKTFFERCALLFPILCWGVLSPYQEYMAAREYRRAPRLAKGNFVPSK